MADHFTVIDYWYTFDGDIVYYVVITDVPCHIWMRYTFIEPQKHLESVTRRGLIKPDDPYYCFVAGHDNEQEEAGDTLTHTFIKPAWFLDQERWMYFWGTIGAVDSPSATGIFHLHRTPDWTPPTNTRTAFSRIFIPAGSWVAPVPGGGIAQIFTTGPTRYLMHELYLFSRQNDASTFRVSITAADTDNKPIGPNIITQDLIASDGVLDGGDGAAWPVYRHTLTRIKGFSTNTKYAIVTTPIIGVIQYYTRFRTLGWIGPQDAGNLNDITEMHRPPGWPEWVPFFPFRQCFELWALV